MPDFSALLRKPAGEAKRPKALPIGDYQGVVKSHEVGDNNKNHTPYVRFGIVLTGWPDEFTQADIPEDTDLSKRQLRKDFFLTDDSLWRLDEFIRSCGVEPAGRVYEEVVPELVGQPIKVEIKHYRNAQDEIGNTVERVIGLNGTTTN